MRSELAVLHRRGPGQSDRFGADLAITVDVPVTAFRKTAFFQLKRSSDLQAIFERKQFDDARELQSVWDRSWALAIDESRAVLRVRSATDVISEFTDGRGSHKVVSTDWLPITRWLWLWLSCDIGPPSRIDDPNAVEPLLEDFRMPPTQRLVFDVGRDFILPDNWLPSRSWLNMSFEMSETRPL